jgi:hypothetical protein
MIMAVKDHLLRYNTLSVINSVFCTLCEKAYPKVQNSPLQR